MENRKKLPYRKCKPCVKCGEDDSSKFYKDSSYCKECHKKAVSESRLRKIGLTPEDRAKLEDEQGGKCAICKRHRSLFARALHMDHDHKTGTARALLCGPCNQLLGHAREDSRLLRMAADYLDAHRA